MTPETEPSALGHPPDLEPPSIEQRLRNRVSMLTQLLFVAGIVVVIQLGIMIKVLLETSK